MTALATGRGLGWLSETGTDGTDVDLVRRFVLNQADVNELMARTAGGRVDRAAGVALTDARSPIAYLNQAVLAAPLTGDGDDADVLDAVDGFFAGTGRPATVLSPWPTPDLRARGWSLVGHPMFVVRAPGPHAFLPPHDVVVEQARSVGDLAVAERVAVDGYPFPEAAGLPAGSVFPSGLLTSGLSVRVGSLDGEPVAVANAHVGHGIVNLCLAATLPAARRRGVWESLVWARVDDGPDLPAVAFTSDYSRPGFVRMGFLPMFRFTLWAITPGTIGSGAPGRRGQR